MSRTKKKIENVEEEIIQQEQESVEELDATMQEEEIQDAKESENASKEENVEEEATEEKEEENIIADEDFQIFELDEVKGAEPIQVLDSNNKPISIMANGDITAPKGFVPLNKKSKVGTLGCHNGRTYQIISNEVGMWTDSGVQFYLKDLK